MESLLPGAVVVITVLPVHAELYTVSVESAGRNETVVEGDATLDKDAAVVLLLNT